MESKIESISLYPSQFAKAVLLLKGKPLNLEEYKPFELVYNINPPDMVIKAGRQIGKSVSLGASIITNSILRQFFNTLYIAPLSQQTSRFSTSYLDPFLASPLVKKHFRDTSDKKNVFEKSLNTGSRIYLGYADTEQGADRNRGLSADQLLLDELQDISYDAVPILKETMSASPFAWTRYTGTAKTENNTLELYWKRSSMCEWVVKCHSCGRYTIPSDHETCLKILNNDHGPSCAHCGALVNMKNGRWLAAKPDRKEFVGLHMPQFIMPARNNPKKWKELLNKVRGGGYSAQKLSNEVFGLASGVGGRILSLKEAMLCCNSSRTEWDRGFPPPGDPRGIVVTTLGVDWSVSGSTKSYTIISILGYDFNGKCYLLYAQKLDGIDILKQVSRVQELYKQYQCSIIGSDRGVGVLQGQMLKQALGSDKVVMVNYVSAKHALRWDKAGQFYAADRTMNIDTIVLKAKMGPGRFETPAWPLTGSFWDDALNVYEEESAVGKRLYRKDPDLCDDWLHSVVFGNIGMMVLRGEFVTVEDIDVDNDDGFSFELV